MSNYQRISVTIFGYESVYTLTFTKLDIFTTIDRFCSIHSCLKHTAGKNMLRL